MLAEENPLSIETCCVKRNGFNGFRMAVNRLQRTRSLELYCLVLLIEWLVRGEGVLTLPRRNTVQGLSLLLITVEGRALADPATGRGFDEAVIERLLRVMVRHCDGLGGWEQL